jgi:serine/threonine protein kinase/Tol biopolymer transport system component
VTPGTRLGIYEVTGALGVGGMGEVYRARDTRLKREVALKLLPASVASDPERVARFQREAEVLASLNHPHIAAIHGLEEHDGVVRALVLELVEGPTLADRIAAGPLPIEEALPIARQIAEAFEAAHEQGIVHRDLKPANVKVRDDGTVKVLDFGLAKLSQPTASNGSNAPNVSNGPNAFSLSPTITSPALMTHAGMLLGTAAYMSPEQAKGRPADTRSDIWAFGCVLYEMLTGRRAFEGEDVSDTMAAVLRAEPDWTKLPAGVPPAISTLLRRCLAKDARRRVPHIGAARIDLDDAIARPLQEQSFAPQTRQSDARRRLPWIIAAAGVVLAAVTAGSAVVHWREAAPTRPAEMRLDILTPTTQSQAFALSPDAEHIAYVGADTGEALLWVRSLREGWVRSLPGTEGANYPFWSPDSRSLGFFAGSMLMRVEISGGLPRALAPAAPGLGGTWNSDGVIVFAGDAGGRGGLQRVSQFGDDLEQATMLSSGAGGAHTFPSFLPDQRSFVLFGRGSRTGLYLGSLDSPDVRWLTESDGGAVYLSPGWLLFSRGGSLLAQRFEPTSNTVQGDPVIVTPAVSILGNVVTAPAAHAADGVIVYRAGGSSRRHLAWFDRTGRRLGDASPAPRPFANPSIAPDGRIAVERLDEGNTNIWTIEGPRETKVTSDPARDFFPVWSHDAQRLFFSSARQGSNRIFEQRSDGTSARPLLPGSNEPAVPLDHSRDGRFLAYLTNAPSSTTREDIGVLLLDAEPRTVMRLDTPSVELFAAFAPNAPWLAYQSNESGAHNVYLRRYPDGAGPVPVSTAGGISPRWSPDGTELYYVAPDGFLMAVSVRFRGDRPIVGVPDPLFQPGIVSGGTQVLGFKQQYDVARDGRFLVNVPAEGARTPPLTLVLNWQPETR